MSTLPALEGFSWDDLRYLEALARLGSARLAGRELGVATSTVYRRIAALEEALGAPCLKRGDGVTEIAHRLAELARRTATEIVAIGRSGSGEQLQVGGSVTISTVDGFVPLLSGAVGALAAACPRLKINLHISDTGLSVRKRQADVALYIADKPAAHLVGRRLFSVDFGVYGTAEQAARPDEARWIVLGWPLQTTREARWERARVDPDSVAVATPSRRAFVDLVAAGLGLGLMPRRLAAMRPELVEVESFRDDVAPLTRPAWLLTHPELAGHVRIKAVLQTFAAHLR
ncbi:MAG: LysR family transcriptional regulator [Nannocystaceae bacterium]|nr:LysR family transcriptional regulator [Nannocystaceae bacterium]